MSVTYIILKNTQILSISHYHHYWQLQDWNYIPINLETKLEIKFTHSNVSWVCLEVKSIASSFPNGFYWVMQLQHGNLHIVKI